MSNKPKGFYKTTPDSFVVQEVVRSNPPRAVEFSNQSVIRGWEGGPYTVFSFSKRRWSAEEAMREIGRQLDVRFADISAHGLKDKQAKTSQHIAVKGNFRPDFYHPDMNLVQLYGQDKPLIVGDIEGNRFDITVLSNADELDLSAALAMPNIFGTQRLGRYEGSEQVGRLFLEGKPEEAIDLMLTIPPAAENFLRIQELAGSWERVLAHPEFQFSFKFEIQKWQSYLWNKLEQELRERLGPGLPDLLPLWSPDKKVREMYKHLWNPDQLNPRVLNFITYKERPTTLRPKDFRAEKKLGSWNFKFDLPSGAYATVVLAQLFHLEERHINT